jgi:RNA polymerase sigma-70 factor (ECF subfamily)
MADIDREQDFVSRLQSGEARAYEELVEGYSDMVYRVCYRILQNPQDAEDAMQEVFLTVYRKIGDFRGGSTFSTWLYKISTNTALGMIRTRNRKYAQDISVDSMSEEDAEVAEAWTAVPDDFVDRIESEEIISRALEKLSPNLSAALVLHELEGLSIAETAEALGISVSASKVRIHRARQALYKILKECLREEG